MLEFIHSQFADQFIVGIHFVKGVGIVILRDSAVWLVWQHEAGSYLHRQLS